MQVMFEFNKDVTYRYQEKQMIDKKLRSNADIYDLAQLVGYYKKENLTVCDIYYIINTICSNYPVHFLCLNQVDPQLRDELISFGVDVAYIECLGTHHTIDMPKVRIGNTVENYWYGIKRFLDRCLFDNSTVFHKASLQLTTQNKLAVRIAYHLICRYLCYLRGDDATLEMCWYDLAEQINEQVKYDFDNYSIPDKEFVYPEAFFKKCKKTQPKRYEKYRARLKEESDRIHREIQEHREKCEEIRRERDARMEMYDKACDKAGCALPWLW